MSHMCFPLTHFVMFVVFDFCVLEREVFFFNCSSCSVRFSITLVCDAIVSDCRVMILLSSFSEVIMFIRASSVC